MHRTGVVLYTLLRRAGASRDEALERIAAARPLTAHELTRRTKKGVLLERAEALLDE